MQSVDFASKCVMLPVSRASRLSTKRRGVYYKLPLSLFTCVKLQPVAIYNSDATNGNIKTQFSF